MASERVLKIWRTSDWSLRLEIPGSFNSLSFSPSGDTVIAGGKDWLVRFICIGSLP